MRLMQMAASPAQPMLYSRISSGLPNHILLLKITESVRTTVVVQRAGAIPLPIRQGENRQMSVVVWSSAETMHNPMQTRGGNSKKFGRRTDHVPTSPQKTNRAPKAVRPIPTHIALVPSYRSIPCVAESPIWIGPMSRPPLCSIRIDSVAFGLP